MTSGRRRAARRAEPSEAEDGGSRRAGAPLIAPANIRRAGIVFVMAGLWRVRGRSGSPSSRRPRKGSRQVGKNKNVRVAADAVVGAAWMANGVLEVSDDLYITG